ncbi:hypothetical protein AVEN_228094-1 [Araneus ventricosus]|uniref:Uncharacterized protein n=1 Tax=Araneus ventricosus TaxID=182803 RepID=A0A4Y2M3A1_ARAVE|nr:hypothetical protein AVEN_228094-1 [Araneus ventricosus]
MHTLNRVAHPAGFDKRNCPYVVIIHRESRGHAGGICVLSYRLTRGELKVTSRKRRDAAIRSLMVCGLLLFDRRNKKASRTRP